MSTNVKMRIRVEREIPGFEDFYACSDGSITKPNGQITRGWLDLSTGDGYYKIQIDSQTYRVHRLIASAWIKNPRPDIFTMCDHIDQDSRNNSPNNLRWVSRSLNVRNSEWNCARRKNKGVQCDVRGVTFDDNRKKWVGEYCDQDCLRKRRSFKTYQEAYIFSKTKRVEAFNEIYEEQTKDYVPIEYNVRRYVVVLTQNPKKKLICETTVL